MISLHKCTTAGVVHLANPILVENYKSPSLFQKQEQKYKTAASNVNPNAFSFPERIWCKFLKRLTSDQGLFLLYFRL